MTSQLSAEELTPERIASLPIHKKRELITLLEAQREQRHTNKWKSYYPEEGPFRRELYPKHMEFFEAGKHYQQRLNMSGNRCISPWTYIQTGETMLPALEVLSAKSSRVRSWDGESECDGLISGGFLRGIEPAFRVVLDNGQFFDCSRKHEVLTCEGFLSFDRLMSLSGGLRCWHKAEDYQANCVSDGYLDDRSLHLYADNGIKLSQARGDALRRNRLVFSQADAKERKLVYSHVFRRDARLSRQDDQSQILDLFSMFSASAVCSSFLHTSARHSSLVQLASELSFDFQSHFEDKSLGSTSFSLFRERNRCCVSANRLVHNERLSQYDRLSLDATNRLYSIEGLHRDDSRIGIFYPSFHPELIGGSKIKAVVPLGYLPIIDGQVPGYHNYKAAGIYHHNCGKTLEGAYETTLHLTGLYPDWWPGRVFDHPTEFWAAGNTSETTRDVVQLAMMGREGDHGSGMIPKHRIIKSTHKAGGVTGALDTVLVEHKTGGISLLGYKCYAQGRKSFEGTAKHGIWFDEETPFDVYGEALMRIVTTRGMVYTTFTPLMGLTELVLAFLPQEYSFSEAA